MAATELKCRLATAGDYEAVMDINRDVYSGFDYLPAKYHQYLANPFRICVVGEIDGKIVTFVMLYVTGDGSTVVYQAKRTNPLVAGRGLMAHTSEFAVLEAKKHFMNISKHCYTCKNHPPTLKYVEANKPHVRLVTRRPRIPCDLTDESLNHVTSSKAFSAASTKYGFNSTIILPPNDAEALLMEDRTIAMSPDGYWVIAFEPFAAIPCNASLIIKNFNATVLASHDGKSNKTTAISFATHYEIPLGMRYSVDFYSHPSVSSNATDMFIAHMLQHLARARQFFRGYLSLVAMHHDQMELTEAEKVMFDDLEIQRSVHASAQSDLLMVEWDDGAPVKN